MRFIEPRPSKGVGLLRIVHRVCTLLQQSSRISAAAIHPLLHVMISDTFPAKSFHEKAGASQDDFGFS
jgi:hypothetical protein